MSSFKFNVGDHVLTFRSIKGRIRGVVLARTISNGDEYYWIKTSSTQPPVTLPENVIEKCEA